MAENTKIEWADHTWNGWRGCEHASLQDGSSHPGCTNCYAETMSKRNPATLGVWGADGKRVRGVDSYWKMPLKWNAAAEKAGVRARVFALSLGDVFEDWTGPILATGGAVTMRCTACEQRTLSTDNVTCLCGKELRLQTMDDLRRDLFSLIDRTPWLDWLLLTKRPQNVRRMWTPCAGYPDDIARGGDGQTFSMYRSNVSLLTSISDQATADAMIPALRECIDLVPVLGLSIEPMLGPVNLLDVQPYGRHAQQNATVRTRTFDFIRWVICGGESGHGARPCSIDWIRSVVAQCQDAGTPVFVKQLGAHVIGSHNERLEMIGEAGVKDDAIVRWKLKDGKGGDIEEFPSGLQVREFPKASVPA